MLPLVQLVPSSERRRASEGLRRALEEVIEGDVRFDRAHQAMYSVDASNYRAIPLGVVRPRHDEDVVRALEVCREHGAAVVGRGGGTSLAGQACNEALVLDFTTYMNRVLEVDPERRLARVQPGVVLDALRNETAPYGLTFGPDPATHDHCTLGGMIGNNSCGIHAVQAEFYGPGARTSNNVESLRVATYDGAVLDVGATSDADYRHILEQGGERAERYRALRQLAERHEALIRRVYPDIPRRVSGYNLPDLLPENGFHVARALVGSEGTCVTVLEATVSLIPALVGRAIVVVSYDSIDHAGDHVPVLRALRPVGCEAFDWRLVDFMAREGKHEEARRHLPDGRAWMLVELGAETKEEAVARAHEAKAALERERLPCKLLVVEDDELQERFWEVREAGLGATAFVPGVGASWPGWEDSAVPPDKVGPYLRDLMKLNEETHHIAALYGHFAQGCIHTRIDFELQHEEGRARYADYTRRAAELCLRYGGSLSGEHGDGVARGDLLPLMFGEDGVEAMREFKRVWDPDGKMNPGRVVDAKPRIVDMRLEHPPRMRPETVFRYPDDDGRFTHAALRCVGVGKCRRDEGGTMCPSWMVTHEEKHTTRGRAHLLWEMLEADVIDRGWRSREVKDALDLCLACKGCKGECPVNVDIATYKAEFLYHYYRRRLRPTSAYAFGYVHRWARLASLAPSVANFVSHAPGLSRLFKAAAGFHPERALPRFAPRTFRDVFRPPPRRGDGAPRVLVWTDTFNEHFHPPGLQALVEVLHRAGYDVELSPRGLCCGRPAYEYGQLDVARRLLRGVLDALAPDIRAGVPVVGLEPSCVSVFRDELRSLFPDDERAARLSEQVYTLSELLRRDQRDGSLLPATSGRVVLHGHCHDKSVLGFDEAPRLLEELGFDVDVPDSGCCGMAGGFGYERDKYEVSRACGERVLLPAVRAAGDDTLICADGFSCRSQIRDFTDRAPLTLPEVITQAWRRTA